jgi:hypothetical protein
MAFETTHDVGPTPAVGDREHLEGHGMWRGIRSWPGPLNATTLPCTVQRQLHIVIGSAVPYVGCQLAASLSGWWLACLADLLHAESGGQHAGG